MLMLRNISFSFLFMNLQIQQINNRIKLNILYQTLYKNPDINNAMFTAHAEEHAVPTLATISRTHLLDNGTWQVTQNREVQVIIDMTWSQHKDQSTDHPTTIGLDPRSRSNSMLGRKIQPAGIS